MNDTHIFWHVSKIDKQRAVRGFTTANPHMNGIDFDTMVTMIFDADMHLQIVGDVEVREGEATAIVEHLIALAPNTCLWFAACDSEAAGTVEHPVLGDVPTCQRCADVVGAELVPA